MGSANPIPLNEGESVGYAHHPRLESGRPQYRHLRLRRGRAPPRAEDEDTEGAHCQRKAALRRWDIGAFCASRCTIQETSRSCQTGTTKRILGEWCYRLVIAPSAVALNPQVMEVAVDPTLSAGSLKAGGRRTGKGWNTHLSHSCCDLHEATDVVHNPVRCGIRCCARLHRLEGRPSALTLRCKRQSSREASKGEAVSGPATRKIHQTYLEPSLDGTGIYWSISERGLSDGVAKFLQFAGAVVPSPGREGLHVPAVNKPCHPQRIPASVDKATPTSCPDLLEFRSFASAVSDLVCVGLTSHGHRSLLRRKALYKRN